MENVTTRYFKTLPVLTGATGNATLKDDHFELEHHFRSGDAGEWHDPEPRQAAALRPRDLLAKEVPGQFTFDIRGPLDNMMAFAPIRLELVTDGHGKTPTACKATVKALVDLNLPLIKDVPKERVKVTTELSITNASLSNAMPGVDISEWHIQGRSWSRRRFPLTGPAKLNGIASQAELVRSRAARAPPTVEIETVVDAKMREKLGVKVADYMSGDVPVKIKVKDTEGAGRVIAVTADLDDVSMKLTVAGWSRPKTKGTKATFLLKEGENGVRKVEDIKLDGPGLHLRGNLEVGKGGEYAFRPHVGNPS